MRVIKATGRPGAYGPKPIGKGIERLDPAELEAAPIVDPLDEEWETSPEGARDLEDAEQAAADFAAANPGYVAGLHASLRQRLLDAGIDPAQSTVMPPTTTRLSEHGNHNQRDHAPKRGGGGGGGGSGGDGATLAKGMPDGAEAPPSARARALGESMDKAARQMEPAVSAMLKGVASSVGGKLEGFSDTDPSKDFRFKGAGGIAKKIDRKMAQKAEAGQILSHEQAAAGIDDALRYTIAAPIERYTEAVIKATREIEAAGFTVKPPVENSWASSEDPYSGVHIIAEKDGARFELQFHTPQSFVQKMGQHKDYEVMRDQKAPIEERRAAYDRMAAQWVSIPTPPGINDLPGLEPRVYERP